MSPPEFSRGRETNPILELKIISASDVSHINATNKMDVYAVVSITGDNDRQTAKTPIDFNRGSNPAWNHTIEFSVNEEADRLSIKIKLFSYWLQDENDLYLGEVNVWVQELLALSPLSPFTTGNDDNLKVMTYPVKIPGGKTKGILSLSYRFFKPEVFVDDLYPSAPDYPNPDLACSGQPAMYPPQFQTVITKLILELVIKSAKDIKSLGIGNDMDVYASVMIREGKATNKEKINTPITYCTYRNPRWDHAVKFSLDEKLVQEGRLTLVVKVIGIRPILGEKDVGEIKVPIQELFGLYPPSLSPLTNNGNDDDDNKCMSMVTRDLMSWIGKKEKGTLSFTYRFLKEQVTQPLILHGTSSYAIVHPEANAGPSNGQRPIHMSPRYHQPQPGSQNWRLPQQSHSEPQQLTQSKPHTQSSLATAEPQGGRIKALGLGAAVLGRVIGGALINE